MINYINDNMLTLRTSKSKKLNQFVKENNIKTSRLYSIATNSINVLKSKEQSIDILTLENVFLLYSSGKYGRGVFLYSKDHGLVNCSNIIFSNEIFKEEIEYEYSEGVLTLDRFTGGNMCHVIYDHACRAWIYDNVVENNESTKLFISNAWPWAKEIIDKTFENVSYLRSDKLYFVKRIHIFSNAFDNKLMHPTIESFPQCIKTIKEKLAIEKTIETGNRSKKLFIGRGDSKVRSVDNEKEISKELERNGYVEFKPEKNIMLEQARAFYEADEIIIFHGAAASNLIFCKENTRVKEVFYPIGTDAYEKVSKSINLNYTKHELELNDGKLDVVDIMEVMSSE